MTKYLPTQVVMGMVGFISIPIITRSFLSNSLVAYVNSIDRHNWKFGTKNNNLLGLIFQYDYTAKSLR